MQNGRLVPVNPKKLRWAGMIRFSLSVAVCCLWLSSSIAKSPQSNQSEKQIEFPITLGTIDGDQFYQQVVSKLHWTTALTTKLTQELSSGLNNPISNRMPVEAVKTLCELWPSAFQLVSSSPESPPRALRVNMTELETNWSQQKLSLRRWLANRRQNSLYELCGQVGFNGKAEQGRLVIVLAGLHGGEQSAIDYARTLHNRTGFAACAFRYPNDAPIEESADYLCRTLKSLHDQEPNRQIVLVTHSMGGLVARSAIEQRFANDPTCAGVTQWIGICPPNEGSIFAEYAGVLEGAELVQRILQRSNGGNRFLSAVMDGFNEAPDDLVPGSDFLKRLATAKRHPAVRYSIVAGDAGLIGTGLSSIANEVLAQIASRTSQAKSLQDRASKLLNSPEFRKGTGDGVVTLQSARLEGVKDIVVLPVNHLHWVDFDSSEGRSILDFVIQRIGIRI